RETGATVLVPIYPLAPPKSTGTATTLVPPMADYLAMLIAQHGIRAARGIPVQADVVDAVLAVREMLRRCKIDAHCEASEAEPSRMVLISPALHLTLDSP
ncbi:alpha/beta hydrolase, partial [Mycobacterium sp. ITM-2017-0098]